MINYRKLKKSRGNHKMKLCWENNFHFFSYGFDDSFKTGIINNSVSFAISFKGYFLGIRKSNHDNAQRKP